MHLVGSYCTDISRCTVKNFKRFLHFIRKFKNITSCSKLRYFSLPANNKKDERSLEVWLSQFSCPSFPSVNTGVKLVIKVIQYWTSSLLLNFFQSDINSITPASINNIAVVMISLGDTTEIKYYTRILSINYRQSS